jgi:hypothetical protein
MRRFTVNMKLARIFKRILESWNPVKNGKRFAKKRRRKICGPPLTTPALTMVRLPGTYPAQIPVKVRYGSMAVAAANCASPSLSATRGEKAKTTVPARLRASTGSIA